MLMTGEVRVVLLYQANESKGKELFFLSNLARPKMIHHDLQCLGCVQKVCSSKKSSCFSASILRDQSVIPVITEHKDTMIDSHGNRANPSAQEESNPCLRCGFKTV